MSNESRMSKELKRIFEWSVLIFIVLSPSQNSLSKLSIFGYSVIVINIALICFLGLLIAFIHLCAKTGKKYFASGIFGVFVVELFFDILKGHKIEIGTILCVLLFVVWFIVDLSYFDLQRIYIAFYISTIVAGIYSIIGGVQGDIISRAATKVDGSIAVICCAIVLFGKHENKTATASVLKFLAFISNFIVAGLGMSRARIALIGLLIVGWILKRFWESLVVEKKITITSILLGPVLIGVLFIAWSLPSVQTVFEMILLRFEDGFTSVGRNEEIEIGINLFKNNYLIGGGWSDIEYIDYLNYKTSYFGHCMYVAFFARGGILLGVPFVASLLAMVKDGIKYRKNILLLSLIILFLTLGYGNAGVFNYTISSSLVLVSWHLKTESLQNKLCRKELLK